MNIFYAPPEQIQGDTIEINGQEAIHASKALRYKRGDAITVVDGKGGWYEGTVALISSNSVQVTINYSEQKKLLKPNISLAMGIIKKKDRLEFAVEKAVELGINELILFTGEHSIKQNTRFDRVEAVMISAMKQSLQSRLPKLTAYNSIGEIIENYKKYNFLVAHQEGGAMHPDKLLDTAGEDYMLVVGPEGGLSANEVNSLKEKGSNFISLHPNRLRTETAAITFLSKLR